MVILNKLNLQTNTVKEAFEKHCTTPFGFPVFFSATWEIEVLAASRETWSYTQPK